MSKLIDATVEFLGRETSSKQARSLKESTEDHAITSKVIKKTGDPDILHVGSTEGGHHVYAHSESDRGEASYYTVHHPSGKMTNHFVEHGGESVSSEELSKKSEHHNVHSLHPSVRNIIHKDVNDQVG